jgi:iron complex transport system ATP-binding protein
MSEALIVDGVDIALGGRPVVIDARFRAPRGKVTGLVGPNGAGKSTLLGGLVGMHRLAGQKVTFDGLDLGGLERRARARICAYVEQAANTQERLSVAEVVSLGRIPHSTSWRGEAGAKDEAIIADALVRTGMEGFADRLFSTLSGGEQQRVHMARALAQQPRLLLLDEPTSHLDIRGQLEALDLLRALADAGTTVLLALHDLNLALNRCDWLVVMHQGRIVAEGTPDDILTEELVAEIYGVRARRVVGPDGPIISFSGAF